MASVACILPAFNVAAAAPDVVAGLRRAVPGALVVGIDDGSKDGTRAALERACDVVVVHPHNLGKGAALRSGAAAALARGCEQVVALDCDGQHDPAFAPRLLAALASADVVIGSRARGGTAMPVQRRASNLLSSACVSLAAGCRIPDSQSGYRAFRSEVLRQVEGRGDRYEYETDFLIRAARAGFRIAAVPIPTIYGASTSHFRAVRDTARVIHAIWRHRAEVFR